jgi:capsular polysaccharide export protein
LSIVVDHSGIHFDPERPSDLEMMLATQQFDRTLVLRAGLLIERIVKLGLTKYNLVAKNNIPHVTGGRIVLVAGQVEDDLSFRLGGAGIQNNIELLARARALEPDAWILYKPHPDVDAGLRCGGRPDIEIFRYADVIVRDVSIPALLERVDAVHVLTSLLGFEALLRHREVVVHGSPFYAGWGLTRDLVSLPRRGRRLSLSELAVAALILYPRYLDPWTGKRTTVETAVERLAAGQASGSGALALLRRWQGQAAKIIDLSGATAR